jgi:hypothetical protein
MSHQEIAPNVAPRQVVKVCNFVNLFGSNHWSQPLAKAESIVLLGVSDDGVVAGNPA